VKAEERIRRVAPALKWAPKRATGWLSLALTLKALGEVEPVPVRVAKRIVTEARKERGVGITGRAVALHLAYALRTGLAEVTTVYGVPCYRLTEKGKEFVEKVLFGGGAAQSNER